MFAQPRAKRKTTLPPPSKKRKALHSVEEITFDNSARAEYLTGFHKRKLQRQKQAKEVAMEKARLDRIAIRKQVGRDTSYYRNASSFKPVNIFCPSPA